jgi:hypothetical protein
MGAFLDLAAELGTDTAGFSLPDGEQFTLRPDVSARLAMQIRGMGGDYPPDLMVTYIKGALVEESAERFLVAWEQDRVGLKAVRRIIEFINRQAIGDPTPAATGS